MSYSSMPLSASILLTEILICASTWPFLIGYGVYKSSYGMITASQYSAHIIHAETVRGKTVLGTHRQDI